MCGVGVATFVCVDSCNSHVFVRMCVWVCVLACVNIGRDKGRERGESQRTVWREELRERMVMCMAKRTMRSSQRTIRLMCRESYAWGWRGHICVTRFMYLYVCAHVRFYIVFSPVCAIPKGKKKRKVSGQYSVKSIVYAHFSSVYGKADNE